MVQKWHDFSTGLWKSWCGYKTSFSRHFHFGGGSGPEKDQVLCGGSGESHCFLLLAFGPLGLFFPKCILWMESLVTSYLFWMCIPFMPLSRVSLTRRVNTWVSPSASNAFCTPGCICCSDGMGVAVLSYFFWCQDWKAPSERVITVCCLS